jgi:hypothetical protein
VQVSALVGCETAAFVGRCPDPTGVRLGIDG